VALIGIAVNVEEEEAAASTPTKPRAPSDDSGGPTLEELPEVVVCIEDVFDCFYKYEEYVKDEELLRIHP
jgi:hypothetical protein